MPRDLLRAPAHDRTKSLGWLSIAWMEFFCVHGPGQVIGLPVEHGDEYTFFVVDCYAVGEHPSNNHMLYDSAFFSRPKGCDKSGLGARLGLFEALGPCRFWKWAVGGEVYEDPWGLGFRYVYQPGEPMGRHVKAPVIQCMATEVGQVGNVFETIWYNLGGADSYEDDVLPPLCGVPGISMNQEKVLLPKGGEIRVATASAAAKDGMRETFVVFVPPPTRNGGGRGGNSMRRTCISPKSFKTCTGPSPVTFGNGRNSTVPGIWKRPPCLRLIRTPWRRKRMSRRNS